MDTYDEEFQEQGAVSGTNPGTVVLHAVSRFPLSILGLTVLGTLVGLAIGLSQPNTYRSVGMLVVRMGAREAQTPESAVDPDRQVRGGGTTTGDELMMLNNPALRERVVERVGAERLLQPYDPSAGDNEKTSGYIRTLHEVQRWLMGQDATPLKQRTGTPGPEMIQGAVNVVAAGTSISAQRLTNTLVISFTAHDPELAQLVASAYMTVCQERHREFFETEDSFAYVIERLAESREKAQVAKNALIAQHEKDGIHNLQSEMDALTQIIRSLEAQDIQDTIQRSFLAKQLAVTNGLLLRTPEWISPTASNRAPNDAPPENESIGSEPGEDESQGEQVAGAQAEEDSLEIFDTIENQLVRRQDALRELDDLGLEYVKTSSQYQIAAQRIRNRIQSINERIVELQGRTVPVDLLPVIAQPGLQRNLRHAVLTAERDGFAREEEALASSMEMGKSRLVRSRQELSALQNLRPVYEHLESDVASTGEHVAMLERSHSKAESLRILDSDARMGNLQVSQEPTLPVSKEGPDRLKTLAMGLFGGLALGMALALARQILDSRLRYPADAAASLGLRVLGVVPEQRGWRRAGKKLQSAMVKRS